MGEMRFHLVATIHRVIHRLHVVTTWTHKGPPYVGVSNACPIFGPVFADWAHAKPRELLEVSARPCPCVQFWTISVSWWGGKQLFSLYF